MDRDGIRAALDDAARARDEARRVYEAAEDALRSVMREADATGLTLVEIARRSGLHRNTVARVLGDTGRRDPGK